MTSRQTSFRIAAASAFLFAQPGIVEAITMSFSSPGAGQIYGIGAPIQYTGTVSWTQFDPTPVTVAVDYMYGSSDATGRILDSEEAIWTNHDPVARSGAWKNKNPATLTATQWNGHSTPYFLSAVPYSATSPYYFPSGNIYYIELELGDVS